MAKLPEPPPWARLRDQGADLVAVAPHSVLWRVHRTAGEHTLSWNALRRVGPLPGCRFDPHDPPPHEQRAGVLYLAIHPQTTLAEVFQTRRVVNRWRGAPYLTGFRLSRTVNLLDLTGTWPTRAGASQAINTGRRDVSSRWARAVRLAFPTLDGLWHPSAMDGGRPCVTLFDPAEDALPSSPLLSLPLSHPDLAGAVATAAADLGYRVL